VFLLLNSRNKNDAYHTGFVTTVQGRTFRTIEGNTNPGGGSEGYKVARLQRTVSGLTTFVRWPDLFRALAAEYDAKQAQDSLVGPVQVMLDGALLARVPYRDNRPVIAARKLGEALGLAVGWDAARQLPTFDGRPVENAEVALVAGTAVGLLRPLAEAAGATVLWDGSTETVTVKRR
jgi:hypothetical protein